MPYTLNGVGTRYYGRANISVTEGVCGSCGRAARLSDYDTREFFCILFIPIVPLQRFRIQRDCSSCRRHIRIPLKTFQAALNTDLAPLREAADRSPREPDAQVSLVQGLIAFRLMGEAEQAARKALSGLPADARLNLLAGLLAAERGDNPAALPLLEKAAAASPGDAETRLALAECLAALRRPADAVRELDAARRIDPSNVRVLELLGDGHRSLNQWSEALQAYQLLADRHPDLAGNRILLRKTGECKKALGYPLSREESKAGRRWWPFGSRARARRRPAAPVKGWKAVGVVAVALAAIAAGAAGWGLWKQQHVVVHFDNGLKEIVTVRLDSDSFTLPPGPPIGKTLAPGAHSVAVSGPKGAVETAGIAVEKQGLFDALFETRFYVYNVAEAHIYRRQWIGYKEKGGAGEGSYEETLVAFQRFFPLSKIDFLFQPAPETVTANQKEREVHRVAFTVAEDVDYALLGLLRYAEGKPAESEKAFRKAIALEPCDRKGRRNLVDFLGKADRGDAAVNEARAWIETCRADAVEAHRAYQDARRLAGEREAVLAEYRALLAAAPHSAINHYLVARLVESPDEEIAECDAALRLDPALTWARVARSYALLGLERYGEAKTEIAEALKAPDCDPSAAVIYACAAIGDQSADTAGATLDALDKNKYKWSTEDARWLLALGARQWTVADRMVANWMKEDPKSVDTWRRRVQLDQLAGRSEDLGKLLESSKNRKDLAINLAVLRFERSFAEGSYREAAAALTSDFARIEGGVPAGYSVYAAAGLLLAGDRNGALALLPPPKSGAPLENMALFAAVLRGTVTPQEGVRRARSDGFQTLKHAYFMAGACARARGDASAASWFEKSERTSLDMEFPLLAARALASKDPR